MFTGIIEAVGTIKDREEQDGNQLLTIASPISSQLKTNQSVAHNGACLSVTEVHNEQHTITAVKTTLAHTNLGDLEIGSTINLERSLSLQDRIEGHFVQGHVDDTALCKNIEQDEGSWQFTFQLNRPEQAKYLIEKGSIAINGVSLTIATLKDTEFTVAIIPYTYKHTNLKDINEGDEVNVEFDMVGKYIARQYDSQNA
jgi:riboflavin synthase